MRHARLRQRGEEESHHDLNDDELAELEKKIEEEKRVAIKENLAK